jgi:hypothetical protein
MHAFLLALQVVFLILSIILVSMQLWRLLRRNR